MINFIPESADTATALPHGPTGTGGPTIAGPYAEAVARLASIRQALACVEQVAGAEPSTRDSEARLAVMWPAASTAARRCFDARSARTAAAAAAGLEAIAAQHDRGLSANPAASERLARELGAGLDEIDQLFSL